MPWKPGPHHDPSCPKLGVYSLLMMPWRPGPHLDPSCPGSQGRITTHHALEARVTSRHILKNQGQQDAGEIATNCAFEHASELSCLGWAPFSRPAISLQSVRFGSVWPSYSSIHGMHIALCPWKPGPHLLFTTGSSASDAMLTSS